MTKRSKRTFLTLTLAALLFCNSIMQGGWQKDPTSAAAEIEPGIVTATGVNVAYHTQEEIRDYVAENGATISDALTFSQEPGITEPYSLGKLSDETQSSAIAMLNQIRYIAGISDQVVLSEDYEELAQAASLSNYLNKELSHAPAQPSGMPDDMYALAKTGASSANIARASWANRSLNETIVKSWMCDDSASNIPMVGHRRWFLNPSMGKTGFGAVSGSNGTYSAVYAHDRSNSSAGEYGVMWPAQNMPVEYFGQTYPWSISMGYEVNASEVQVTLTRVNDGKSWIFSNTDSEAGSFYVNNDNYGQKGCIIFRPETDDLTGYNAGDVYQVSITGLSDGDVSYTVQFFSLSEQATPTQSPTMAPTPSPSVQPTQDPGIQPTQTPSVQPTLNPSTQPTQNPGAQSTTNPGTQSTQTPDTQSTQNPGTQPTQTPDTQSTQTPGAQPTTNPDAQSTSTPGTQPTQTPDIQSPQSPAGSTNSPSSATSQAKVGKPSKVKLLSLKSTGKKKLNVKWKWKNDQNGYQIQYATNRKFTKNKKTIAISTKASSKTIKGLKSKKTYFVRVRAVRTAPDKKYYGSWSSIKKCKVK